jgi:outer membrane immunogenic protein
MRDIFSGFAVAALLLPTVALADGMDKAPKPMPAYEAAPTPVAQWTGFFLGAGLGSGSVVHKLSADVTPGGNLATFDGIGGTGMFGKLTAGYDRQVAPKWVVGAFIDFDFSDIKSELNIPIIPFSAKLKHENSWTVGGRLGYLTSPSTLWYSSIGYTQADYKLDTSVPGFTLDVPKFNGYMLGTGVESHLRDGWFLKAEYRYTKFERESIYNATILRSNIDVGLEPVMHTGFVALTYKFGRPEASAAPMK